MKKVVCMLLALALLLQAGAALAEEKKPFVVAAIFPEYDFVRAVAGDRVDLKMLLKPGAEVHTFEPAPQDIIAIRGCDLFFYGGGESDGWVEDLLESTAPMQIPAHFGNDVEGIDRAWNQLYEFAPLPDHDA